MQVKVYMGGLFLMHGCDDWLSINHWALIQLVDHIGTDAGINDRCSINIVATRQYCFHEAYCGSKIVVEFI